MPRCASARAGWCACDGSGYRKRTPCKEVDRHGQDHGSSVKNDKQYEGPCKKGMSKSRAAAIANTPGASKKGGKNSAKKKSS